jgi:hypothetical protein
VGSKGCGRVDFADSGGSRSGFYRQICVFEVEFGPKIMQIQQKNYCHRQV